MTFPELQRVSLDESYDSETWYVFKHSINTDIMYRPDNLLRMGHWWNNTDRGQVEVPG